MVRQNIPLDLVGSAGAQLLDVFRREMEDLSRCGQNHEASVAFVPRTDIAESDEKYELWIDLPGMKSEDLTIEFHEGRLTVAGERVWHDDSEADRRFRRERSYGEFRRVFRFEKDVDSDNVSANYEAGVLHVVVKKTEKAQPKRIEIQ